MHGDLTTKLTLFKGFNYCLFLSFIFCLQINEYFITWCALMLLGRFGRGKKNSFLQKQNHSPYYLHKLRKAMLL